MKFSLPSVKKNNTRQRGSLPSVKKKHSANSLFAECQKKTLGKGIFAECPKNNTRQTTWHSAKSRSPVMNGAKDAFPAQFMRPLCHEWFIVTLSIIFFVISSLLYRFFFADYCLSIHRLVQFVDSYDPPIQGLHEDLNFVSPRIGEVVLLSFSIAVVITRN